MNGENNLNDIISKLTENPEMMKNLMNVAGSIMNDSGSPQESGHTHPKPPVDEEKPVEDVEAGRAVVNKRKRGDDAENLIRLLCALKPYVSHDRCEKIDSVIKILKVIQLGEKTGLLKSLL